MKTKQKTGGNALAGWMGVSVWALDDCQNIRRCTDHVPSSQQWISEIEG